MTFKLRDFIMSSNMVVRSPEIGSYSKRENMVICHDLLI